MPRLTNQIPAYRLHKQSGQAIVTLCGRDHLLGKYGSAASRAEYNRLVSEWIAADRRNPAPDPMLTITELIDRFRHHAEQYYAASEEAENYRHALRPLRKLYGATPAAEFGPLKLKALRDVLVSSERCKLAKLDETPWSRTYANRQIARIKHLFRWATASELLPASIHQALATIDCLRHGRTAARETNPVQPVADALIDATLPHLSGVIAAMVMVQRLTGARAAEICAMRIGEVDRTGDTWTYRPPRHKTMHHGHDRIIHIGPKAQAAAAPFMLKMDPAAHVFSPRDAVEEMRQRRADNRKTPLSCGNRPGTNRMRRPERTAGDRYSTAAYRRAIARACDDAFPVPEEMTDPGEVKQWRRAHRWHPHQLRHTAATQIRSAFGIEAAQHTLGHSKIDTTLIYAEKNANVARRVAAAIG